MNAYKALKSIDAEIILDLERGKAIFDYSLNKYASPLDSNHSCYLSKERINESWIWIKIKSILSFIYIFCISDFVAGFVNYFPKYQYTHQKLLKLTNLNVCGMIEEAEYGEQKTNKIKFHINNNIWFDYTLEGDYKDQIKKVSLLRHFVRKSFGRFIKHRQDGWDVIFEFKEPPKHGNVVLRSIA